MKKTGVFFLILISIMAIIVTASQIYNILNHDIVLDNKFDNVEYNPYNEGEKSSFLSLDFNYIDTFDASSSINDILLQVVSGFTKNNDSVYDVQSDVRNVSSLFGEQAIGVQLSFSYDFEYNENYPIQDLKVFASWSYKQGDYENDDGFIFQIFGNGESGSIKFYIVETKEQFETLQNGNEGKAALLYKEDNKFTLLFSVLVYGRPSYSSTSGIGQYFLLKQHFELYDNSYQTTTIQLTNGKNIFSIEENELINILSTDILNTFNNIILEWKEGKELATLKCSIGEYYNEDGTLAISTKQNDLPMLFDIGDLVIPYIAVANGKTEPLSIKLDGTPKVFKVTQIRPYFDGAFWQEITLQEQTT